MYTFSTNKRKYMKTWNGDCLESFFRRCFRTGVILKFTMHQKYFMHLSIYGFLRKKQKQRVTLSWHNKKVSFNSSITETIRLCTTSSHNLGHRVTLAAGWSYQSNSVYLFSLDDQASFFLKLSESVFNGVNNLNDRKLNKWRELNLKGGWKIYCSFLYKVIEEIFLETRLKKIINNFTCNYFNTIDRK